jgi:hypothetical protein
MTIKNSKFSETVASNMDKILDDPNFKKIFSGPVIEKEISAELKPDTKYQAFVRIASTTDDCMDADDCSSSSMKADDKSSSSSKKPTDVSEVMNIDDILGPAVNVFAASKAKAKKTETTEESSTTTEQKKGKKVKKAEVGMAVEYMINSLLQTSAALDNLGFSKSSALSLGLIDSLLKEASIITLGQEVVDQMADRVNEMTPEDILADSSNKKMSSGYTYLLEDSDDWKDSSDELWSTEIYDPTGSETYVGDRNIDGSDMSVFKGSDGKYYAQLPQNTTDENNAEIAKPHEDVVEQKLEETQKDRTTNHEAPAQGLPLTDKHHHSRHLVDYDNDDDGANNKEILQTKPVEKMPKPETTIPTNPSDEPYKKDLVGLASLLNELETWIKS